MKAYLTNGGNILLKNKKNQFYFRTVDGEFIRQVTNAEADYLKEVCLEANIKGLTTVEDLPEWVLLTTVNTCDDWSNFDPRMCNNGGAYSNHINTQFWGAIIKANLKIRCVDFCYSSSDFHMTSDGRYQSQNDCITLKAINAPGFEYVVQGSGDDNECVLEQFSDEIEFHVMWNMKHEEIPERDLDEEKKLTPALSFTNKKEILTVLKSIYATKVSKVLRRKNSNRR